LRTRKFNAKNARNYNRIIYILYPKLTIYYRTTPACSYEIEMKAAKQQLKREGGEGKGEDPYDDDIDVMKKRRRKSAHKSF
jgi:hypothetical protein